MIEQSTDTENKSITIKAFKAAVYASNYFFKRRQYSQNTQQQEADISETTREVYTEHTTGQQTNVKPLYSSIVSRTHRPNYQPNRLSSRTYNNSPGRMMYRSEEARHNPTRLKQLGAYNSSSPRRPTTTSSVMRNPVNIDPTHQSTGRNLPPDNTTALYMDPLEDLTQDLPLTQNIHH